jgi:hypothetical protein
MTRTLTLKEFMFEELNRQLRKRGHDVQIVEDRPRPRLVAEGGEVVPLRAANQEENCNG